MIFLILKMKKKKNSEICAVVTLLHNYVHFGDFGTFYFILFYFMVYH